MTRVIYARSVQDEAEINACREVLRGGPFALKLGKNVAEMERGSRISPNPNLRALRSGPFYAVKMVLNDLGTCGGLRADARAHVTHEDGSIIDALYAIGNTAANAFGASYPGAGATIGQGLVFGYIAAHEAAKAVTTTTRRPA